MNNLSLQTLSGQYLLAQHIVMLDVQTLGEQDQRRAEVHATLSTSDRQLLASFSGADAEAVADRYLRGLLDQLGLQLLPPADGRRA